MQATLATSTQDLSSWNTVNYKLSLEQQCNFFFFEILCEMELLQFEFD